MMQETPPPGWYVDPDNHQMLRWWDGAQWTAYRAAVPDNPVGTTVAPQKAKTARTSTWVIGAIVAFVLLIMTISGGIGGLLITLGLAALITSIYAIVTGRRTWARLPHSRPAAIGILAGSLLVLIIGSTVLGATHPTDPRPVAALSVGSTTPTPRAETMKLEDFSFYSADKARAELVASGYTVTFEDVDGNEITDPSGWNVDSQYPTSGTAVERGATITLTLTKPSTPTPTATPVKIAAPAPVPAPAPAPAKPLPAPAPAPAKPAPAPAKPAPAPANPVSPGGGATALCNDGTYSYAAHHQGACSHHGGVAEWYK